MRWGIHATTLCSMNTPSWSSFGLHPAEKSPVSRRLRVCIQRTYRINLRADTSYDLSITLLLLLLCRYLALPHYYWPVLINRHIAAADRQQRLTLLQVPLYSVPYRSCHLKIEVIITIGGPTVLNRHQSSPPCSRKITSALKVLVLSLLQARKFVVINSGPSDYRVRSISDQQNPGPHSYEVWWKTIHLLSRGRDVARDNLVVYVSS